MKKIAVVIINFNGGELLAKCLSHLREQTFHSYRVIVVDNASNDGSAINAERDFPEVKFIHLTENIGFAGGNNIGIAAAEGSDWIACLNPDAFPEPTWLENLINASIQHPQYQFLGSTLLCADNPEFYDGTADIYHVSGAAWRRDHLASRVKNERHTGEIFGPCAAAAMYRRDLLNEIGGFDEHYFCYFEDVDLAFRLRLKGYRCLYVPSAIVHHMGSAITGYQSDFTVYHGHRNLEWTYFKNMPLLLLIIYLPQHILLNLASLAVYSFRGKAKVIFKAKLDALLGLPAILKRRKLVQSTRTIPLTRLKELMRQGLFSPYRRR